MAFGRTEFRRRWGDRKLEDNWRRSNRARVNIAQVGGGDEAAQEQVDTTLAESNYKKPEYYLKNLPLTDSLMAISDDKIAIALLNAGRAYSERLLDNPRATVTYESLIARYPDNELVPEVLYDLYRVNKEDNSARSEVYRQRLLLQYPESEYAKILSDPAYYEKKMAEMKMAEKLYNEAFTAYNSEVFNDAISLCAEGLQKYPQDQLAPKFQLLHAYAVARTSDERSFKAELSYLIKTWPKTTESTRAEEIITYLNQKSPELMVEEDKVIAAELYKKDTTVTHVFALIISDPVFNINQATFDVISYNIDNYTNKNYRTEGTLINNKYLMITVSGFSDYSQAKDYYNKFNAEKNIRNSSGKIMMTFIINMENLQLLNNDCNPGRYQLFFEDNYLK
jgi:outer membrane protein assembly factor BamD (BamD/ComL family)